MTADPSEALDKLSYYRLLGMSPEATKAQIIRKFRDFGRRYHPDRYSGQDEATQRRASLIYRRGSEAYQVLIDPNARSLYDKALTQGILRLTADQRDRAEQILKPKRKKAKPEFETVEAWQLYQAAVVATKGRDYRTAWRNLADAYELEPENPRILQGLEVVEDALRKLR